MDKIEHEKVIIQILEKCWVKYVIIDNNDSLVKIYNLFNQNIVFNPITSCELLYVGTYHHFVTKNYVEMEKYYLMAVENGNYDAMRRLAVYYQNTEKNYVEMEKYYLMAIKNGDSNAMNNLGSYHQDITKNYVEMEKYYLMAIENGSSYSMDNLGIYHLNITKNYVEMEKYYLMAIKHGNCLAMNNLGNYHKTITNNYIEMEKYYLMAIKKGMKSPMNNLINYYKNNNMNMNLLQLYINNPECMHRTNIIQQFNNLASTPLDSTNKELFLKLLLDFEFINEDKLGVSLELLLDTLQNNISTIDLHFTYTVNGKGYEDAKSDYLNRCLGNCS